MTNAEEQFWTKENCNMPKGTLHEVEFHSGILNNDRKIWTYTPKGYNEENEPYCFLLLTDGEEYINILSAIKLKAFVSVILSHSEGSYEVNNLF